MKKLMTIILCLGATLAFSQTQETVHQADREHLDPTAEKPAEYPGGMNAFRKEIAQNINIKSIRGVSGKLSSYAKFAINVKGEIESLTTTGGNEAFNKEVERAITSLKTKWTPASYQENLVKYWFTVPFIAHFD
ncbi:TonB C terminal [Chryseobacterium sp. YR221]|nr:TonB C terminal [Chryseobacterium sp. YR221]